jgi:hypothetical protein
MACGGDPGAHGPESGRVGVLRCAAEDVHAPADVDVAEARSLHERGELVREETASDATGPQAHVGLRATRNGSVQDNVGELDPAARAEDPEELGQGDRLVGHKVEYAVRDDSAAQRRVMTMSVR